MKKLIIIASVIGFSLPIFAPAQDSTAKAPATASYLQKKKEAKGLITTGIITGSAGLVLGTIGVVQFNKELLSDNSGEYLMYFGAGLLIGGSALLVAGLITDSNANKMKDTGKISLAGYAPPIAPTGVPIQQQGITLKCRLGR